MVSNNDFGSNKCFVELVEKLLLDDREEFIKEYTELLYSLNISNDSLVTEIINIVHYVKSFTFNPGAEALLTIIDFLDTSQECSNVTQLDASIDSFIGLLKPYLAEKYPNIDIADFYLLLLSTLYLNIFIISNWTGPQIGYISPSDKVLNKENNTKNDEILDKLLIFGAPNSPLRDLSADSLDFSVAEKLGIDGEIIYDGAFGLPYFYIAKRLNYHIISNNLFSLPVWNARIAFIHQSIIRNGYQNFCNSLAKISIFYLSESLKQCNILNKFNLKYFENEIKTFPKIDIDDELKALLLLELSKYLYIFGFYHLIQEVIDEATRLLNISVDFTGKLGIRRKYQKIPYPQLVVKLTGTTGNCISNKFDSKNDCDRPNVLQLNEIDAENDILESPSLLEDEESVSLKISEQALLLSMCLLLSVNISSDDEMGLEQLNTLSSKLTIDSIHSIWCIITSALWFKTKSEHTRSSRVCRAAMQLDELSSQFYNTAVPSCNRLKYFFSVYYPSIWEIRREAAKRLLGVGSLISACDLYNQLGMYEDSIICLTATGRMDEAKKLINKLFNSFNYPYLWCSLGDIEKSEQHYLKAWELSNKKYARAQRSLGSLYYNKKLYLDASKAFEISLSINPLNKSVLYTLGCCYMHLEQFDKAVETFSKTILLDPQLGDVWANMASSHFALKNYKQAKLALEEAIKYNRSNGRVWQMYLSSSLLIDDLCSVCKAVCNLYELGLYDSVKPWSIAFILSKYTPQEGDFYNETIKNTFKIIKSGCRSADIWKLCSQFCILNNDFNEAVECIFKQHRRLLEDLKTSDNPVKHALLALDCYKRILSISTRVDIKDNLNSFITYLNNNEIKSKEIDEAISELQSKLNESTSTVAIQTHNDD